MSVYKLSYQVGGGKERHGKMVRTEIELAHAIMDMERDVGMICHGVQIEQIDWFDKDVERPSIKPRLEVLEGIKRWTDILLKHHKQQLKEHKQQLKRKTA